MTGEKTQTGTDWSEFYEPDLYEQNVGPGLRVADAYVALLARSGPMRIAEYGCGPGQIVIDLARAGHTVIGIDRSPRMVERARLRASEETADVAQRITIVRARIEDVALQGPVDAVLMPNELVLHVLEPHDLVRTFAHAFRQIAGGGRVILDLPVVDFELLAHASGKNRDLEFCRGYFPMIDGTTLRVSERIAFSAETWRKEMIFRYERISREGTMIDTFFRRLEQRVWTTQEVCLALQLAGAADIEPCKLDGYADRVFVTAERQR